MEPLADIKSPEIIYVIKTIKAIQTRMKEPDMVNESYVHVYDKLGKEFSHFSDSYMEIFKKVIRGESLGVTAASLFYKDRVMQGLMEESTLSEILQKKYMTAEQQKISSEGLKKMKETNNN